MRISEFDYVLPDELVAQQPLAERDGSRMLVIDRTSSRFEDRTFADLPDLVGGGDVIVLNDTKVFPARLLGRSDTGAEIEIFLVRAASGNVWEALARPARRLRPGKVISIGDELYCHVVEKLDSGRVLVRLDGKGDVGTLIDRLGRTPLPPYIKRGSTAIDEDRERYQTVFAANKGAIAAPTAGLHFTEDTLALLQAAGVEIARVTLHVGYGTFEPVRVDDLAEHSVAAEYYSIGAGQAEVLNRALADKRRIIAIGTTSTRALEDCVNRFGRFEGGSYSAELTIVPGYRFRAVGGLLTNFHLPKSSLLVLTSTFGGHELIMEAYRHAVASRYRFYSYGDCMLIL